MRSEAVSHDVVLEQLSRITASEQFAASERLSALLRYVVEQTVAGRAEDIKEYTIAVEVFGRPVSFDPRLDTIVRVQASKARAKLKEYYAGTGAHDAVLIDLPRGTYVPVFRSNDPASEPAGPVLRRSPSIAVLPFADMSPNKDQEYFCDGIAEELINALAKIDGLHVVARTSAFEFHYTRAILHTKQGEWRDAEKDLREAIGLAAGKPPDATFMVDLLDSYAVLLRKIHRGREARPFEARASALSNHVQRGAVVDVSELAQRR